MEERLLVEVGEEEGEGVDFVRALGVWHDLMVLWAIPKGEGVGDIDMDKGAVGVVVVLDNEMGSLMMWFVLQGSRQTRAQIVN